MRGSKGSLKEEGKGVSVGGLCMRLEKRGEFDFNLLYYARECFPRDQPSS